MADTDIIKLWSDGLTRVEIALRLDLPLTHVRTVLAREALAARAREAAKVAGARSPIGALARKHGLGHRLVYERVKAGKTGDELIKPPRAYGKVGPRPYVGATAPICALPAGLAPVTDETLDMVVLAKQHGWPLTKICSTFDLHPQQVEAIRAPRKRERDDMLYHVAGERLTVTQIAARAGVKVSVISSRIRLGWRGLQLLQPLQRERKAEP